MTVCCLPCGCEALTDETDQLRILVSHCPAHVVSTVGMYACGECGFASWRFDRLERHVYAVHLGAQVA